MPPRSRQATQPPVPGPTIDNAPTRRSRRTPAQAPAPVVDREGEESFDLEDVSGSDDDDDISTYNPDPTYDPSNNTTRIATPSPAAGDSPGVVVNNPELAPPKVSTAADVHYFFEKHRDKMVCVECQKAKPTFQYEYSVNTSNTSLRPHIERHHLDQYKSLVKERGWQVQLPGLLSRSQAAAAAESEGERPDRFSEKSFHELLVKFIIANDQSLNLVECPEFRDLLFLLRSDLKEKNIPRRTKLREMVIRIWKEYFQVLKRELEAAAGQISFTMDIWSDQNRQPYLAITAHWVAKHKETGALTLKSALIAFHRVQGSHDGISLADIVLSLLDRAGVTMKLGHFTLDNAANNKTMMEALALKLSYRDIYFDAADRRIMCFAHIIDLTSGRVIREVDAKVNAKANVRSDGDSDDDADDCPLLVDDIAVVPTNPIALARSVVRVIWASGIRRQEFTGVIRDGNANGWFTHDSKAVTVPELQLLRDVQTRWDSVFHMLKRLRGMRPAIDFFLALPKHRDLASYTISPETWSSLQDVEVVLGVPHVVQQVMSVQRMPILSGSIPAFESFMTTWETLREKNARLEPMIQKGLDLAYRYYDRMDHTKAYAVAMFLNPAIRMSWIQKHWGPDFITRARSNIRQLMHEYREKIATSEGEESVQAHSTNAMYHGRGDMPAYMSLATQYGLEDMEIGDADASESVQTVEQEYHAYVTGVLSSRNIEILKFWENHRTTYPTIYKIALDYLPIQASAVPCERVFSSSAETDTKRRNRISPLMMEALQMVKFGLRDERLSFTAGWGTEEKQMIDDKLEEDVLHKLLDAKFQDKLDSIIQTIEEEEE